MLGIFYPIVGKIYPSGGKQLLKGNLPNIMGKPAQNYNQLIFNHEYRGTSFYKHSFAYILNKISQNGCHLYIGL